eukprot:59117-Rhodomonas_salina.1
MPVTGGNDGPCSRHLATGQFRALRLPVRLHCEIKHKKTHSQFDLYQECVFWCLISGCQPDPQVRSTKIAALVMILECSSMPFCR